MRWLILLLSLTGCAVVDLPLSLASAGVWAATGKTPTDHVLSNNTGMDCQTIRIFENQPVCQKYIVRYVEKK
jgi:hypothetical protein